MRVGPSLQWLVHQDAQFICSCHSFCRDIRSVVAWYRAGSCVRFDVVRKRSEGREVLKLTWTCEVDVTCFNDAGDI